jgi:rod shape-determining protein MreC
MRLRLAAREDGVMVGDLVSTAGGGLFPKGLPVGRVARVNTPTGLFRIVDLEPAVDLARIEEVLVLPRELIGDLSGAFSDT